MQEDKPFAGYNKIDEVPTLVGNWVEERALKDMTGVARTLGTTQAGAALLSESTGRAAPAIHGDVLQATHPRVIEHAINQTHPADWRSHTQTAYLDPAAQNKQQPAAYVNAPNLGPRERMMREEMMRQARDLPPEAVNSVFGAPIPVTTETVYGADFKQHDLTGISVGARVMRDQDARADTVKRDPTFLVEHNFTQKHAADRLFGDEPKKAGARETMLLPNPDVPVTLYSEAVAAKMYGGTFAGTATLNAAAPFGKATNFSKPISEYNKVVIDE